MSEKASLQCLVQSGFIRGLRETMAIAIFLDGNIVFSHRQTFGRVVCSILKFQSISEGTGAAAHYRERKPYSFGSPTSGGESAAPSSIGRRWPGKSARKFLELDSLRDDSQAMLSGGEG